MRVLHLGAVAALLAGSVIGCGSGGGSGGAGGTTASGGSGGSGGHAGGAGTGGTGGTGTGGTGTGGTGGTGTGGTGTGGRGFPEGGPWVSFYGPGDAIDIDRVASAFRIINIDVDPDTDNFTDAQITALKAGGKNRVISYLNVGSCEEYRSYWDTAPPGLESCVGSGALTTIYGGYPDERWANLGNVDYQDLIVEHVAPRRTASFSTTWRWSSTAAGRARGPATRPARRAGSTWSGGSGRSSPTSSS